MPNGVTAAVHEQRFPDPRRRTRLLKLRPAKGSGVGGGDREPRTASRRKVQEGRLVVKQLAHTGDSPPVT